MYTLTSRWQIPLEVTVKGEQLDGFLGPLFLLTPLALLALRFREGRQLLFAGALFCVNVFQQHRDSVFDSDGSLRFAGFGACDRESSLAGPAAFGGRRRRLLAGVYGMYCGAAWRIEDVPIEAALRIQSEEAYLRQDPDYKMVSMINRAVPPGGKILAVGLGGASYLEGELMTGYRSAAGEIAEDILWTPVVPGFQPVRSMRVRFRRA